MKNLKRKMSMLLGVVLLFNLFTLTVFAGDKKALNIESSSIQDGDEVSSEIEEINLEFTNNVINMSVKENNMKCFEIIDKDGDAVDFEVVMGDDQIEPEKKRMITLSLKDTLKAGESYKVKISSKVVAKNGSALGEDIEINFTTAASSSNNYLFYILAAVVIVIVIYIFKKKNVGEDK